MIPHLWLCTYFLNTLKKFDSEMAKHPVNVAGPLAAATLPRNFGQQNQANPNQQQQQQQQQRQSRHRQAMQSAVLRRSRQGTSSTAASASVVASSGFMQLPSPPDPPSSFALSALVTIFFFLNFPYILCAAVSILYIVHFVFSRLG